MSADPMMTTATTAAATVSGERLKLHIKSLSTARDHHPDCAASEDTMPGALISANGGDLPLDPQARIDDEIEKAPPQFDNHEKDPDHNEVGRHNRDVGEGHRLDEHQTHARPLEHSLGDDGERNNRAELQSGD